MRIRSTLVVSLNLALVALLGNAARAVTLVKEGKPASLIVTGNRPLPSQQKAADELQYHLKRMTGATLPILREQDLGAMDAAVILVGQSDRLAALGIDTAKLPPETFVVKTIGNTLILAGEDGGSHLREASYDDGSVRTGTMYAVYDFLQDQLGCRWLWPGRTGEVIPKRSTVEVRPLDLQETPKLFRRHFRGSFAEEIKADCLQYIPRYLEGKDSLWAQMEQEERLWLKRMRMGQSMKFSYGHAFTDWLDKYGKTQPDLLARQADGSRGLPDAAYPKQFVKLCVSNPKLVDLIAGEFAARRARDPNDRFLNACENDGSRGFCLCDQCRALDKPLDEKHRQELRSRGWSDEQIEAAFGTRGKDGLPGSLSNRYFTFYNRLAHRVAEIAPDASVVVYAYSRYRFAPLDLKLEPNLLVGVIGFNFYPMTDTQRLFERENFLAWKESGIRRLFFRPNSFYYSPAHGIPWSAARQMGEDMQFLVENGIVSTDFDRLAGHWSTAAPTYYTVARLHWDTALGAEGALKEFYQSFGPAAGAVGEYFDYWEGVFREAFTRPDLEQILKQSDPEGGQLGRGKAIAVLLGQENFDTGRRLLEKARRAAEAAGDPELAERIAILELGRRHGELLWRISRLNHQTPYDKPVYFSERWPLVQELFRVRESLAKAHAHNIFYLTYFEVYLHDLYGTRVYQDFAGRAYQPVMTPADVKWTFACDPQNRGETLGWPGKISDLPEYFQRNQYEHLFFRTWDNLRAVARWKQKTGKREVVNGWYQVDLAPSASEVRPGDVLYLPSIRGTAAKIWIDGRPVREVTEKEIRSGEPIILPLSTVNLEPGKSFRLTVKVTSPGGPGGLIGPAYIARGR
jgi:hypothetical protein